jgi:hypothetical protein
MQHDPALPNGGASSGRRPAPPAAPDYRTLPAARVHGWTVAPRPDAVYLHPDGDVGRLRPAGARALAVALWGAADAATRAQALADQVHAAARHQDVDELAIEARLEAAYFGGDL